MSVFHLTIISSSGKTYDGKAEAVVLPGARGSFGILANHVPLIGALETGLAKVTREGGTEQYFIIGKGFVDVSENEVGVIVGNAAAVRDRETGLELLSKPNPWKALEELQEQEALK